MEELRILQKTEDMICYANQCLLQFPKVERYAFVTEIKKSMYGMHKLIIAANKKYYKKTTFQEIDVELEILRAFIKLAADRDISGNNTAYLPLRKYEIWSGMLNEIGRMLGAWIKASKQ
jgi:hypothetical protein